MEQCVESNFVEEFKTIASTAHTSPHISSDFFQKQRFLRKSSIKPGH